MKARDATEQAPSAPGRVSPDAYARFIGQIDLDVIWLHTARIANHYGPETPKQGAVRVESDARWEPWSEGFRAFHGYQVRFETTAAILAEIDVTFGLQFTSSQPMTDPLFTLFSEVNLPVNTWPFVREFVSTTVGRLQWLPFTLPALKRGVTPPSREPSLTNPPSRPRRRRTTTQSQPDDT